MLPTATPTPHPAAVAAPLPQNDPPDPNSPPQNIATPGFTRNYLNFLEGYFTYIAQVTSPYPPLPPGAGPLPPLPKVRQADVDWVRSLRRGAYPAIVRGRPWAITPQETDALQNGQVDSLPPGPAWVSKVPKGGEKLVDRLRAKLGE